MGKASEVNEIINESILLCKENKATFITPIVALLFSFIIFTLGIWAYVALFQTNASLIGLGIIILIITMYLRAFFAVMQSWIVANTVWKEKVNFTEGLKRTFKMYGEVIGYSFTILIVGLISQSLKRHKKNFLAGLVRKSFEGLPEDVWDDVAHLALPSMAITKNKFPVALQEVRNGLMFVPEIKIKDLGIEYFTYPMFFIGLIISTFLSIQFFTSLGVLVFLSLMIVIYLAQSYLKTTYYTVLYIWMGEQIQRKKKKKPLESRVPAVLENTISINLP